MKKKKGKFELNKTIEHKIEALCQTFVLYKYKSTIQPNSLTNRRALDQPVLL